MSHSKVKIWLHGILGVKDRGNLIDLEIEEKIHNIIKKQIIETNCFLEEINGTENHIHILFLLNPQISISDFFKQIKGGSSHDINYEDLTRIKFSWQTGYGAFSVSESNLEDVKLYIKNQKEHHKKMTFQEEYDKLIKLYKLEKFVNR